MEDSLPHPDRWHRRSSYPVETANQLGTIAYLWTHSFRQLRTLGVPCRSALAGLDCRKREHVAGLEAAPSDDGVGLIDGDLRPPATRYQPIGLAASEPMVNTVADETGLLENDGQGVSGTCHRGGGIVRARIGMEFFPMWDVLRKNLTVSSGVTRDHVGALASAVSYLDSNPALADTYVTNIFAADAVQSAFEMAAVPAEAGLKVVLTMT
jgi:hypothetical protein